MRILLLPILTDDNAAAAAATAAAVGIDATVQLLRDFEAAHLE